MIISMNVFYWHQKLFTDSQSSTQHPSYTLVIFATLWITWVISYSSVLPSPRESNFSAMFTQKYAVETFNKI